MSDFLLKPTDLEVTSAIEVWGSQEKLRSEIDQRDIEWKRHQQ
ncbi:unnamed protein product, partial [Timema podura]|nr:unnamed protein product [Timema podura]